MPGIVEFPTIVQQAARQLGAIFANEPERRHFAEYLTGLLVSVKLFPGRLSERHLMAGNLSGS